MPPDHDYHELAITDVVDETADTRSFVLDVPAGARGDVLVRRGSVLHLPGDDRRRLRRALLLDVELAGRGRPADDDGQARSRRRHVELDERRARSRRHHRGDATGRPLRLAPHATPIVAFAGGSGITPVISIIKSALATTTRAILLVYAEPRRRGGHLRRRVGTAARRVGRAARGASSPRRRDRVPGRARVRRARG